MLLTYISITCFSPQTAAPIITTRPEHSDSNNILSNTKGCLKSLPFTASQAFFFSTFTGTTL